MAEESENKPKLGQLVTERFDEATCRDEFEGDNICVLHGLERRWSGPPKSPAPLTRNIPLTTC